MSAETIGFTEAEWRVMECLWAHAPLTGREAAQRLQTETGWSRSTVLTLLRRLEEKGAVTSGTADGLKTFSPLVRREDAALRETEDFLGRVYHGSLRMMVSSLTRRQALPQEEIDGLYALLREMEAKQSD